MAIRRLLLLTCLAGCSAGPSSVPGDSLRDSLAASRASLRAIQGEGAAVVPRPAAPPAAQPQPAAAAIPPPQRAPGGPVPVAASEFLNNTAESVRAVLGAPSLRRSEGPAEIWLYEAPRCRLDIILYRDGEGPLRVAHAAARAAGMETQTEADCLRDIAGGRTAPQPTQPRA